MSRLRKGAILLLLAGAPAAALPLLGSSLSPSRALCFTNGPVTYRLAPGAAAADYRLRIDNTAAHPDLRVRLVERAELADFTWVDDPGVAEDGDCSTAGVLRTVQIVTAGKPSDLTIAVSQEGAEADFALFVHSARVARQDAAALFALMRHVDTHPKVAGYGR